MNGCLNLWWIEFWGCRVTVCCILVFSTTHTHTKKKKKKLPCVEGKARAPPPNFATANMDQVTHL